MRSIQNSKYIQNMKVFEKYLTFSGKLDGSPRSSFYSHHIPILNFIFCHGSNNLILGFSDFIRILKKWVQDIWNYIFLHFFGNLMISKSGAPRILILNVRAGNPSFMSGLVFSLLYISP